jgi:hypothetical protein
MKCDDDDVPTENENNDPFAGCCVIFWERMIPKTASHPFKNI